MWSETDDYKPHHGRDPKKKFLTSGAGTQRVFCATFLASDTHAKINTSHTKFFSSPQLQQRRKQLFVRWLATLFVQPVSQGRLKTATAP